MLQKLEGLFKKPRETQVSLFACVLVAFVALGCGLPSACFVGRAMERNKTSYRHLEDKRKKRDASWRELQDVEESVYDGPYLAHVYANGRYVPLIGSSTLLTTARLLGEEEKDRADRKVQMEKEKAEEEEQYRTWQEGIRIHLKPHCESASA